MSVFLFPVNYFGPKCAGGTIHTYLAGSLTPQVCYQDDAGAVPHSNPININSDGFSINSGGTVTNLWLDTTLNYRVIVKTSAGVTVWDLNGVSVSNVALTGGLILGANLNTNGYEIVGDTIVINPTTATEVNKLKLTSNADANGYNWQFDNDTGLLDDEGKKQLIFYKASTAVNYTTVTNAATTQAPQISVDGTDTNIDLKLNAKGTGRIKALKGLDVTGTFVASSTGTFVGLESKPTSATASSNKFYKPTGGTQYYLDIKGPSSFMSSNQSIQLPDIVFTTAGKNGSFYIHPSGYQLRPCPFQFWTTGGYATGGPSVEAYGYHIDAINDSIFFQAYGTVATDGVDLTLSIENDVGTVYTIANWALDYYDGSSWTRNTTDGKLAVGVGNAAGENFFIQLWITPDDKLMGTARWSNTSGTEISARISSNNINNGSVSGAIYKLKVTPSSGNLTAVVTSSNFNQSMA